MSDETLRVEIDGSVEGLRNAAAQGSQIVKQFADDANTHGSRAGATFGDVGRQADGMSASLREAATEGVSHLAAMVAEVFALHKAFELLGEGIHKASEIRDLSLSLNVFTGSVAKGREALEFFERQQINTRNTAEELAHTFRDVLPLAIARGFSQDSMQHITVMLSQLGTIAGHSLDEMESSFRMLLSGRAMPGRNPLLQVLGVTKADVKNLGWDQIIEKMAEISGHFPEFGQTWESTMRKAKESMLVSFAEGFNGSRDTAVRGMADVNRAVESLQPILVSTGEFISAFTKRLTDAAEAWDILFGKQHEKSWLLDDSDIASANSADAAIQRQRDIRSGRTATSGIEGVTGFGGSIEDFWAEIGSTLRQHKDEAGAIMTSIRDEVDKNATVAWRDVATSIDAALHPTTEKMGQDFKALGKVMIDTADTAARKWNDLVRAFDESVVHLDQALGYAGQKPGFMNLLTPGQFGSLDQLTFPSQYGTSALTGAGWNSQTGDTGFRAQLDSKIKEDILESFAKAGVRLHDDISNTFGDAITTFAESGGRNFGQIGAAAFRESLQRGSKVLGDEITNLILGAHYDPQTGGLVNSQGQPITNTQLKNAQGGVSAAFAGIGDLLAGIQAGRSGASGARTSATLSGAAAGAGIGTEIEPGIGTAIGAAIGAIVGAIGGAIGAAQRQAEYKYGVPGIDATGHAYFSETKNYTDADAKAIVRQIQATYDAIHDSLVRTLMKLDNVVVPIIGAIDGRFQPNPSGHFEQHLQTWESSTEGDIIFKQFESEFDAVRTQLGISVERWNATMSDLNLVDPTKRAQLFDQLVTGKLAINKALQFFAGENYGDMLPKGSTTYESYTYKLSTHQPFTEQQKEADDEILRFATNIKGLSFEGQIAAEAELGQKMTDRASAIRSAIEGIFQAFEDGTKKYRDAFEQTDVLGFTSDTGTVDQAGLAKYYKQRAQDDLTRERFAQNPQLVSQFNDQFIADIMKAGQAALASGATAASVAAWEREQLQAGEKAFDAQLTKLGTDIDKLNTSFTSQLDPALQALYSTTNGVNTVIGDVGNHLHDIIDPIDRVGAGANSVADQLNNMSDALSRFSEQITTLQFIARTVASRGAA